MNFLPNTSSGPPAPALKLVEVEEPEATTFKTVTCNSSSISSLVVIEPKHQLGS